MVVKPSKQLFAYIDTVYGLGLGDLVFYVKQRNYTLQFKQHSKFREEQISTGVLLLLVGLLIIIMQVNYINKYKFCEAAFFCKSWK